MLYSFQTGGSAVSGEVVASSASPSGSNLFERVREHDSTVLSKTIKLLPL